MNKNKKTYILPSILTFKLYLVFFSVLFSCLYPAQAYRPSKGRVTGSAGPFVFNGDLRSGPDSFYDKPRLGLGLITEAVFANNYALEIGVFGMEKMYLREEANEYLVEDLRRLYITTGLRRWLSNYFSLALNLFSSFSMGDPNLVDASSPEARNLNTLATRSTASVYGADLSVRFEFELSSRDGLFIDNRYSYNLSGGSKDQANHIMIGVFYYREIKVK